MNETNESLDAIDALDTILEDFLERYRVEPTLDIDQFIQQYPEYERDLKDLIPCLISVERASASGSPSTVESLDAGAQLGEYQIVEKIAQGGMGSIYKAYHVALNRYVAIKILLSVWRDDEILRAKFLNEGKTLARLQHPNILTIYGVGSDERYSYLVMELIHGTPLNRVDLQERFPHQTRTEIIAHIALQIAQALTYAHSHGILHCDIKPSNLLLDEKGNVLLTDFGLSRMLEEGGKSALLTQVQSGTLAYMAPEQLLSNHISVASEQYSLGLTLYELYVGRSIMTESNPGRLVDQICSNALPPLRDSDKDFATIINKSLHFLPADRYKSMESFAADWKRYLNNEPIHARSISLFRRFYLWTKRKPAIAYLSLLAVILVSLSFSAFYVGYIRVNRALKEELEQRNLSERNSRIAYLTFQKLFHTLGNMSQDGNYEIHPAFTSATTVELLKTLLPYYQEIVILRQVSQQKIMEAYSAMSTIYMQLGHYEDAESALCHAILIGKEIDAPLAVRLSQINFLGLNLFKQGKTEDAEKIWGNAISQYQHNPDTEIQLIVANMKRNQLGEKKSFLTDEVNVFTKTQRQNAQALLQYLDTILEKDSANQEALYLRASVLGEFPRLHDVTGYERGDALTLLQSLIKTYPTVAKYKLEFIRFALYLPIRKDDQALLKTINNAVYYAEDLLMMSPLNATYIMAGIAIYQRRTQYFRVRNDFRKAQMDVKRTLSLLYTLVRISDDQSHIEKLINLQFKELRHAIKDSEFSPELSILIDALREKIELLPADECARYMEQLDKLEKKSQRL